MTVEFKDIVDNLIEVDARPGKMYVYKNDMFVSLAIKIYGEYCQAEIEIMKQYIPEDSIYVDVGLNIGYHAMSIHKATGCKVVAFEPHPTHFLVAAENCKGLPIQLFNAALSSRNKTIELTDIDLTENGNYGETKQDTEGTLEAQAITLDSLNVPPISGMKIDVEGHEYEVLKGSEKTIDKYRPVILYEALELDWTNAYDFLDHKGYNQYWLACFNTPTSDTYIPKEENVESVFGHSGVSNIIAIPKEKPQINNLIPVMQDESYADCVERVKGYIVAF